MRLKFSRATPAAEAARMAVIEAIKPHADEIGAVGLLAVMSYTVGQLVALQDQTKMTPAQAMELVAANIEQGNQDAIRGAFSGISGRQV